MKGRKGTRTEAPPIMDIDISETTRKILKLIKDKERSLYDLVEKEGLTKTPARYHLKKLHDLNLIKKRRVTRGKRIKTFYSITELGKNILKGSTIYSQIEDLRKHLITTRKRPCIDIVKEIARDPWGINKNRLLEDFKERGYKETTILKCLNTAKNENLIVIEKNPRPPARRAVLYFGLIPYVEEFKDSPAKLKELRLSYIGHVLLYDKLFSTFEERNRIQARREVGLWEKIARKELPDELREKFVDAVASYNTHAYLIDAWTELLIEKGITLKEAYENFRLGNDLYYQAYDLLYTRRMEHAWPKLMQLFSTDRNAQVFIGAFQKEFLKKHLAATDQWMDEKRSGL